MSPRTGRPPLENPRSNARHVRLSDDELKLTMAAADKAGQSWGDWAREKLIAAAKRAR